MIMSSCSKLHIKNPIPDSDWKCPKCGADNSNFAIWDIIHEDCDADHSDDYASCNKCGYGATLGTITKNYWKNKGIEWIKCPHCKGSGKIAQSKTNQNTTKLDLQDIAPDEYMEEDR
jgi:rubredoxin